MEIGIVTFHCSYNFGSALQAWALKEYLESKGHNVHVIDYRSEDFVQYRLLRFRGVKSFVSDFVFLPRNMRRRRSFHAFWNEHFNMTNRTYKGLNALHDLARDADKFDAVIAGSDQIWNLDCTCGPNPIFFLAFVPERCLKIAYAPSLAHKSFNPAYFTADDKKRIAVWLNRFNAISVRELAVAGQFEQLTTRPFTETLDPTLLLNLSEYRNIEATRLPCGLKAGNFLFAYTLWPDEAMNAYVDRIAEKQNLTIAYYSKKQVHYKSKSVNCYGMGPSEFLAMIDKASSVVSNSFHATVFSILFSKPFLTFSTDRSTSRISTLLNNLGLSTEHLIRAHNDSTTILPFASYLDSHKMERLRRQSEHFLSDALKMSVQKHVCE